MSSTLQKWDTADYSQALSNAICQNADDRFLSKDGQKFKFNGFWRNGTKQNVCAWIDKATWHDAKTGEGGGCKEFAQVAFGMSLKEFMDKYGSAQYQAQAFIHISKELSPKTEYSSSYVNLLWHQLQKHEPHKTDDASKWLSSIRGIANPRIHIGSGYINLINDDAALFEKEQQDFIRTRTEKGQIVAVPLRNVHSDKVQNLFLRIFSNIDKAEKSRLLPNCGGWGNLTDGLRAFGFPHLIDEFPNIVLCEGMADYFAAEYLLDGNEKHLPLGAANADALIKWAQWLAEKNYKGYVHFIYQLDSNDEGKISKTEIGPKKALEAAQILLNAHVKAKPFNWFSYLNHTTKNSNNINDIADSLENERLNNECGQEHLQFIFQHCLQEKR